MAWEMQLDNKILEDLYQWLDTLPLSRSKERIERDFSDGFIPHSSLFNKIGFFFFFKENWSRKSLDIIYPI